MDIKFAQDLLESHWKSLALSTVVVAPVTFFIADFFYKSRVAEAEAKSKMLERERDEALSKLPAPKLTSQNESPGLCFARVNDESQRHLISQIQAAKTQIRIFGLTRNFYARDEMKTLIERRSKDIPIKFFIMHPDCSSRKDRYRVEPMDAAFEAPKRFRMEIEPVFKEMLARTQRATPQSTTPGLAFYYFDFPCQFSIDQFDDLIRVSFYGLDKQGRESPIWVFNKSADPVIFAYFISQLDWVESLAAGRSTDAIRKRKLSVVPLDPDRARSSTT